MKLSISIRRGFSRLFAAKPHKEKSQCYYDSTSLPRLEWISMLDRTVCLQDGLELGKIEALNVENVVIKKGAINPTRYYFGHSMLKKHHSGNYVVDLVSSELILYKRDMVPNPSYFTTLGGSYFGYLPHRDEEKDRW